MKCTVKPVRKLLVNIYPMDEWLLAALSEGRRGRGRSSQDARTIRRALRVLAGYQGIRPPDHLLEIEKGRKA
jgi:hypothetical protein